MSLESCLLKCCQLVCYRGKYVSIIIPTKAGILYTYVVLQCYCVEDDEIKDMESTPHKHGHKPSGIADRAFHTDDEHIDWVFCLGILSCSRVAELNSREYLYYVGPAQVLLSMHEAICSHDTRCPQGLAVI